MRRERGGLGERVRGGVKGKSAATHNVAVLKTSPKQIDAPADISPAVEMEHKEGDGEGGRMGWGEKRARQ